jgi:hypothetical protein
VVVVAVALAPVLPRAVAAALLLRVRLLPAAEVAAAAFLFLRPAKGRSRFGF